MHRFVKSSVPNCHPVGTNRVQQLLKTYCQLNKDHYFRKCPYLSKKKKKPLIVSSSGFRQSAWKAGAQDTHSLYQERLSSEPGGMGSSENSEHSMENRYSPPSLQLLGWGRPQTLGGVLSSFC